MTLDTMDKLNNITSLLSSLGLIMLDLLETLLHGKTKNKNFIRMQSIERCNMEITEIDTLAIEKLWY